MDTLSLGKALGYLLQPFIWFLGIPWEECEMVREGKRADAPQVGPKRLRAGIDYDIPSVMCT